MESQVALSPLNWKALGCSPAGISKDKAKTYTHVGSSSCTRNLHVPWKQKVLWASGQLLKWDLTAAATGGPRSPRGAISFHIFQRASHPGFPGPVPSECFIQVLSMTNCEVSYYVHFTGVKIRPGETPARPNRDRLITKGDFNPSTRGKPSRPRRSPPSLKTPVLLLLLLLFSLQFLWLGIN